MKAIVVLADGTRFVDREVDEAAVKRGYVEFRLEPDKPIHQTEQRQMDPLQLAERRAGYCVCLHAGNEDGVPVFRERYRPTPLTQKM